ncbi:MAG: acetate--CoA ligase family protein, partial [Acidimicrobiia bacterium]|nr:acetate--CoA ligase family protein [Acidimicrobiia bacterium]
PFEELFAGPLGVPHLRVPRGHRVALLPTAGGPGILAADACEAAGLEVPELSEQVQTALRAFTSPDAGLRNPVDLVASATAGVYEQALRVLLASDEVDSVLVIFVPPLVTEADDVAEAIVAAAAGAGPKPVVACFLAAQGIPEALRAPWGNGTASGAVDADASTTGAGAADRGTAGGGAGRRSIPSFSFPEAAAAALGRAVEYAAWRHRPEGRVPVLGGIDRERAESLVAERLDSHPDGVWLDPDVAATLLGCFGIPVVPTRWVASEDGAVAAAADLGLPAVLKVGSGAIVHKTDVGGVHLGLESEDDVRDAFRSMSAALGDAMGGAVVQPMLEPGVETIVGVTHDESFGPLVLFGLGGLTAELMRDTALRVMPITDVDARELVRSLRGSPLLFGYRGRPAVDVASLEDLLLRVGAMVDAVPEIAEMDVNPVIVSPRGAVAVDVKVRLAPAPAAPLSGVRRMREA